MLQNILYVQYKAHYRYELTWKRAIKVGTRKMKQFIVISKQMSVAKYFPLITEYRVLKNLSLDI